MKTLPDSRASVRAERLRQASVNAALVRVRLKKISVTPAGAAAEFALGFHAAARAPLAAGVKALAEKLAIVTRSAQRSDACIGRAAREAFMYMTYVPQQNIKISVTGGRVTLAGEVPWEYQRKAAADGIRGLAGVIDVLNKITIERAVSLQDAGIGKGPAQDLTARKRGRVLPATSPGMDGTYRGPPQSFQDRDLGASYPFDGVNAVSVPDQALRQPG